MDEKTMVIEGIGIEKIQTDTSSRMVYRELRNTAGKLIDSERCKYYTLKYKPIGAEKATHGNESVHEIEYEYDKFGNVVKFYESGKMFTGYTYGNYLFDGCFDEYANYDEIEPEEHKYRYDERGRIISETINGETTQYLYNDLGNIIVKTNGEKTYVFDYRNNKLRSVITACGTKTESAACAYDENGYPRVHRNCYLNWDNNGRLTEYDGVYFSYDEIGNRKSKNDITYEYKDGMLVKESGENRVIEYFYGMSGVIAFKFNGKLYYYIKTLYGDMSRIVDENNNIVAEYHYDAFGNYTVYNPDFTENNSPDFIGNINPIRFRSHYFDTETKLYIIGDKYYAPEICRYISPDYNGGDIFKPNSDTRFKI